VKRIVIFGATSAIAQACARIWTARGCRIFLVGRNPAKLTAVLQDLDVRAGGPGRIHAEAADLDVLAVHEALIAKAEAAMGGIDVALIAHGTLPDQAACANDAAAALREIQTNALSVISLATLLARGFEARGAGQLAVISSVAGDRGRQSNYVYGAAKGMVSLFLQGLRNRLFASGVHVLTIKPGFVDTPMTAHIKKGGPLWASPEQVAKGIVWAIDRRRDVAYVPGFWRPIMAVIRALPESVFKRLHL
jgi:decaprenylphospho-beta-D-erythro-pentofuranosid-2-ulose 2-reductase